VTKDHQPAPVQPVKDYREMNLGNLFQDANPQSYKLEEKHLLINQRHQTDQNLPDGRDGKRSRNVLKMQLISFNKPINIGGYHG
jgi:hypothetical protein